MSIDANRKRVVEHFVTHLPDLYNRDYILDLFTVAQHRSVVKRDGALFIETKIVPHPGQLVLDDDGVFMRVTGLLGHSEGNLWKITAQRLDFTPSSDGEPLLVPYTPATLRAGMIANYPQGPVLHTSVGRILLNYLILAVPFGDKLGFLNQTFTPSTIEKPISALSVSGDVNAQQVNLCTTMSLFVSGFLEYVTPTLTEKTLLVPDEILARKKELLEIHKEELARGNPSVMIEIENELVKMLKAHLKKDPSMIFLRKGSYFSNILKRLLLTLGTTEEYGNKGNFVFLPNSLEEGWTTESFSTQANEIRSASYGRSMEVAKGGEESNFLKRIFQNTKIAEEDCKTTRTVPIYLHKRNISKYVYRNILVDGKIVTILPETASSYIGKTVNMRDPTRCATPDGNFCFTCMGKRYEAIGQDKVAAVMNEIGGQMSQTAMKAMHDTTKKSMTITNLNDYVLPGTL